MKGFFLLLLYLTSSLAIFAQTPNSSAKKNGSSKITYTCTMHPDVITDQPGKCLKCGMKLVKVMPKIYTCPMHSDVVSDNPGKCSKCGMTLVEKKSKAKLDEHNR
jgi:hypothetical protein